jgi:predicted small metal-binding protein
MFEIRCREVGFDCPGVVVGRTREDVLAKAAEHAGASHGVTVTPELAARVAALIRPSDDTEGAR